MIEFSGPRRVAPGHRRVSAGVLAAVAGVCLGVGAGVVPAAAVPAVGSAPAVAALSKAAVPKGLESFYGQKVEWYDCVATGGMEKSAEKTGFRCAKVKVPLDYSKPDGQTIEIAMKKHSATGSVRQGTLFMNPGGPGGSGVDDVGGMVTSTFAGVQKSYDIIGFDPRGVGSSTAVNCTSDTELEAKTEDAPVNAGEAATTFEQRAAVISAQFKQFEASCAAGTKPAELLDHVDTVSVARDLDVLRALSGDQKLNYAGFSYGTYLGAHYAELFPANTGHMVLDGTLDPSISLYERQAGAMKGLERALRTYVDWCQAGQGCPLTGGTDAGVQQVRDLFASVDRSPLPSSDPNRPVTGSEIRMAVMYSLYGDEQNWSGLSSSLDEAINQRNGALIRQITGQTVAEVVNTAAVREAITCLDYP
ncbi:alpha/beta fold hydrolase, partial [uncultured Actinomyces sp.]|uniref:alpha/beta fold hydrolase n=1 Tax=uncultured Actinomyces sp. TaxID=249061 RepID=UPI002804BAFA